MAEPKSNLLQTLAQGYSWLISRIVEWFMSWRKVKSVDKKTILVVDGKVELANLVKYQLIEKGYDVVVANDGMEALNKLKKISPDLIVLDINMPKMGGLELYNKISTQYGRSKYPVLVLTERAGLEDMFKDIDADGFLPKPFEIDHLVEEVDRIISGQGNPTVLLVDLPENPFVQQIKDALSAERYQVTIVEGLEDLQIKTATMKPVCILMEYMQKGVSGEDLIREIKANAGLQKVPLIVYSNADFEQYRGKSLEAGADKYIGKPDDNKMLISAIREFELGKDKNWGNQKV